MTVFSKRLRYLREKKELTQLDLAKMLRVANSTISQYESGKRMPDSYRLEQLAKLFDVSIDWLIGGDRKNSNYWHFDDDEQFFLRASKLSEDGKKKLWDFLDYVEHWETEYKKKQQNKTKK